MAEAIAGGRNPLRAGAIVGALALAAGALTLNRLPVGVFYDDGLYAGLAVALAEGHGYVHPHLPGTPAAVHYPPLYPLLLAPLFGLLPLAAAALAAKVLNLLLAGLTAGLVAWHAVRAELLGTEAPRWLAPAAVAAAAIAIPVLTTESVLFSEPLFGLLLALAVVIADRASSPAARLSAIRAAALAGGLAALALLTRSIGVAAGAGIAVFLLGVRRASWREGLAALGPVAVAAVAWGAWLLAHQNGIDPALAASYGSYGAALKQAGLAALGARVTDPLRPLIHDLAVGWVPSRPLFYLFGAATLAVGVYGLARLVPRSSVGWTLVFYMLILALWPYPSDRFLWAVLPWLALAWAGGAVALWQRRRLRAPVALVAAAVIVGYGLVEARGFAGRRWGAAARRVAANYADLLPWLSANLPPDAVLATDGEALVWLYTRRTAVPFFIYGLHGRQLTRPTPAEHRAYLDRQGVTHILLADPGHGSAEELDVLLGAYPGWLPVQHAWGDGRALFRIDRGR